VIDCIHIEQLELYARVGIPTSERSEPQRLILNITLWPKIAELHDEIENTVNYAAVAEYVRVLQPSLHYELERIAKTEILRKLKRRFGGKTIRDIRFRLG
jgi:FolB domain-containing protein